MPYDRRGYKPPINTKVWKPGCKCTICGGEILKQHLSKVTFQREYEEKWGVHWGCQQKMLGALDRNSK